MNAALLNPGDVAVWEPMTPLLESLEISVLDAAT